MAKSAITLADEAADALLVKPQKKPSNLKGILAVAAVAFALGLAATTAMRFTPALISQEWSLTVEGGLGSKREFPLHSVDPNYVSFVVDPASLEIDPPGVYGSLSDKSGYPYPVDFTSPALKALTKELAPALFVITAEAVAFVVMEEIADGVSGC